jgi:hypothetical protein
MPHNDVDSLSPPLSIILHFVVALLMPFPSKPTTFHDSEKVAGVHKVFTTAYIYMQVI